MIPHPRSAPDEKAQKILDCALQISRLEYGGLTARITRLANLKSEGSVSIRIKKEADGGKLHELGRQVLQFKKEDDHQKSS